MFARVRLFLTLNDDIKERESHLTSSRSEWACRYKKMVVSQWRTSFALLWLADLSGQNCLGRSDKQPNDHKQQKAIERKADAFMHARLDQL